VKLESAMKKVLLHNFFNPDKKIDPSFFETNKTIRLSELATVNYYPNFLTSEEEKELYDHLLTEIPWQKGNYNGVDLPRLLWSMHDESSECQPPQAKYTGNIKYGTWTLPVNKVKLQLLGKVESKQLLGKVESKQLLGKVESKQLLGKVESKQLLGKVESKQLLGKVESKLEIKYCEINYYPNGSSYIGWHSDREMLPGGNIFALSLGCERTLLFKRKKEAKEKREKYLDLLNETPNKKLDGNKFKIAMKPRSLLVMNYEAGNTEFLHSLKKEPDISGGRIVITFRQ
jgi:alkylated DNA repair dioxygenase AlkB